MSQSLSRWQAIFLGLVTLTAVAFGAYGISRIAAKQGLWNDTVEVTAGFPEVHDITPGTPVRIRGVDAGQVIAVEYPDHDGPNAEVTIRMRLQSKFAQRLYADATAHIYGNGVFGAKVISIQPGDPNSGTLAHGRLRGVKPFGMEDAVAEVRDLAKQAKGTANEVKLLASEARDTVAAAKGFITGIEESNGTFAKLIRDDDLYEDARGTLSDLRKLLGRADKAVGHIEGEMTNMRSLVADGRDTLKSVKQGSDALGKLPVVRNYVEDSIALLVRPTMHRERWNYDTKDLFEPGTATLTSAGRTHIANIAAELNGKKYGGSDIVVVAFYDPNDKSQTPASATELTKKQAEVVIEQLKAANVHKLSFINRRKLTPLGMGINATPAVETDKLSPSNLQILLYYPR